MGLQNMLQNKPQRKIEKENTNMADKFSDIKLLHEIEQYDDFYDWLEAKADENEAFWGTDLNEEKAARVKTLIGYAHEITQRDRYIHYELFPINNRSQNAGVQLQMSNAGIFVTDERVKELLALLSTTADLVWISALGEGIVMNFHVLQMWDTKSNIYERAKRRK